MKKTGQRGARSVKTYALYGLWKLGFKQWCRHAPLYMLRQQLVAWNSQRMHVHGASAALNTQDILHIRQLIERAQHTADVALSPTLLDQWFFQAIGAIRVQSQTGVDTAWHLFEQSVHEQLGSQSFSRSLSFGLVVTLSVVWMTMVTPMHQPTHTEWSPLEETQFESSATADPVTLSLLNLAYQKMQNGSCQLPQAAMLPDAQRQAFIMFVTNGKVDVDHVEQLRQALGYVSCLYPQELMRPQGRERF
ncbi:hypothetical protein [Methylophilus sp. Leaf414]|uniref:hypothetical protein n=1 Tax=Methylophilus sp. Leaf414 TaxID=1736371 RepID=UPI0006F81D4A|nr:hypothetical protein [Methylophilus sp. Leaf414]KQT37837.1 hypothetical protein ASG24_02270 [Methylophilus sp. Leaf414]